MTFNYATLNIPVAVYKKALDAKLKDALIEGGKIYLNAALAIIPVWSGASWGTFLPLARKIGATFSIPGHVPWLPGPPYGAAQSSGSLVIHGGIYRLQYGTTLWHLIYNEYNQGNLNKEEARVYSRLLYPGPYNFQEKAGEAFQSFATTIRLPNPWLLVVVKRKRVG